MTTATAVLVACGGGGSAVVPAAIPAPAPVVSVPASGSGSFVVTNATVASRNGTYSVSSSAGTLPAGNTDIDYNGNTADGNFEWDVQYTSAGVIKSALVWYYEANNAIVFFGCGSGTVPCTGVTYDAASKKINYANVLLAQATNVFSSTAAPVTGGGTITVNGAVSVR